MLIDTRLDPNSEYSIEDLGGRNEAKVNKQLELGVVSFKAWVIMLGLGDDQSEGVADVHLGWLQDIVSTTVKVTYVLGSGEWQPMSDGKPLPPPWLDSGRPTRPPSTTATSSAPGTWSGPTPSTSRRPPCPRPRRTSRPGRSRPRSADRPGTQVPRFA